jgi:hypothetical protein
MRSDRVGLLSPLAHLNSSRAHLMARDFIASSGFRLLSCFFGKRRPAKLLCIGGFNMARNAHVFGQLPLFIRREVLCRTLVQAVNFPLETVSHVLDNGRSPSDHTCSIAGKHRHRAPPVSLVQKFRHWHFLL